MQTINSKLININDRLMTRGNGTSGIGLHTGDAGHALYFGYYARQSGEEQYLDHCMELIAARYEQLDQGISAYNICDGLAGLAWVMAHLVKEAFFDLDLDLYLERVDAYLSKKMLEDIRNKRYDFLHSGLGLGLYFLERLPNPTARESLQMIIDLLHEVSTIEAAGISWVEPWDRGEKERRYNLGLAHGVPAIITFLSLLKLEKIQHAGLEAMIESSVNWLLSQKSISKGDYYFPPFIHSGKPVSYGRLAWCYGDLGVANALWLAGEAMKNDDWTADAINIMHHAAQLEQEKSLVSDGSFCHGCSGVSHIFRLFYLRTQEPAFKKAADFWTDQLLNNKNFQDEEGLWPYWMAEKRHWVADHTLINGLPGIGLSLMSAQSKTSLPWDRCFLLS